MQTGRYRKSHFPVKPLFVSSTKPVLSLRLRFRHKSKDVYLSPSHALKWTCLLPVARSTRPTTSGVALVR